MTRIFQALTLLLLLTGSSLFAQINTMPQWDGLTYISSFGVVNTATYGQTITVPTGGAQLASFAVQIGFCGAPVTFRGEVYAWNGTMATGAALFESAVTTVPGDAAFHLVTIDTGSLSLAPGTYVLFASTSRDQAGAPASACRWGSVPNTAYPGGQFVFLNNGANPAQWTTNAWSTIASDLAIQATFTTFGVPTLSEWAMILLACGLMFVAFRRLSAKQRAGVGAS